MKNQEAFPIVALKYCLIANDGGCWGDDPKNDEFDRIVLRSTEQEQNGRLAIVDPELRNIHPSEFVKCKLRKNDILITKSSGSPQHIGKSSLITTEVENMNCAYSNFMQRIRVDEANTSPIYISILLNSEYVKRQFQQLTNSTVGLGNLNAEVISNIAIPKPPRECQTKIANYLDKETQRIDALIDAKQKLLTLLSEKRRAMISHAVTKGLNPKAKLKDSGIPWLGEIPVHWGVERSKWILPEHDERSEDGTEELLSVSHITGVTSRADKDVNMFMAESLEGYKKVRANELVINTLWAWMGAMGVSPIDGIASPAYNVYSISQELIPEYLNQLVRMPVFVQEVTRYSKGVWSSRLRLYPEGLYEVYLPIPPIAEQEQIIAFLKKEQERMATLEVVTQKSIDLIQERRSALITAAVTGEIEEAWA